MDNYYKLHMERKLVHNMVCGEFQKLIPDFIEQSLNVDNFEQFTWHANECKDCMEELEIHYMIRVGLERIEQDNSKNLDIIGELKARLAYCENKADSLYKYKIYKKFICIISQVCTGILLIIQILLLADLI